MNERVVRARKVINLIQIFFVVLAIFIDIMSFRFGVAYGLYRTVISVIPLTATLFMYDSILKSEKKSVFKLCFYLILGVLYSIFLVATYKSTGYILIFTILLSVTYLAQVLYLFISKDIKGLFQYNNEMKFLKWLWSLNRICIGYKEDDCLWSYNGKNIGRFYGNGGKIKC